MAFCNNYNYIKNKNHDMLGHFLNSVFENIFQEKYLNERFKKLSSMPWILVFGEITVIVERHSI